MVLASMTKKKKKVRRVVVESVIVRRIGDDHYAWDWRIGSAGLGLVGKSVRLIAEVIEP